MSSDWSVAVSTCVCTRAMCPEIFVNTRRLIVRIATGRRIAASTMAGRSLVIVVAVVVTVIVIRVLGENARHHILHFLRVWRSCSRFCMMLAMTEKGSVKTYASEFGVTGSGTGGGVERVLIGVE